MRIALANPKVNFFIGDVRNADSILTAMESVDFVFHAAALKQVPSCEFFPIEAIRTNDLGAENVMNDNRRQPIIIRCCQKVRKQKYIDPALRHVYLA